MSYWERSGASDEWYTPKFVFDALGERFDMDVAAPMLLPSWIGDRLIPTNLKGGCDWNWKGGPEKPWRGFIWMNPPFGGRNSLEPWLAKFFDHGHGIALTPDRTSAPWFHDAFRKADAVLFTRKIKFLRPDGSEGKSPSNGTALFAAGERAKSALRRAANAGLGILAQPLSA